MRVATVTQRRLDCTPVNQIQLNTHCRHEMVPFLRSLQHIYDRIANKKGPGYQERLKAPYGRLLEEAEKILDRAEELERQARRGRGSEEQKALVEKLAHYRGLTERVRRTPGVGGRASPERGKAIQHL